MCGRVAYGTGGCELLITNRFPLPWLFALLLLLAAVYTALLTWGVLAGVDLPWLDLLYGAVPVLAVGQVWYAQVRTQGGGRPNFSGWGASGRLGWALLSLLALAVAEVAYMLLFELPGVEPPDVSFVDGLYYLYYLGLLGVLWMDRAAGSQPGHRPARGVLGGWLLDSLITVVVVGEVSWVLAVSPLLQDSQASVLFKAVSASYVVLDLTLLTVGLLLLRRRLEPARLPLVLGLMVYVGADFAYLLLGDHYQSRGLLDALWAWGTVGQAVGVTLLTRTQASGAQGVARGRGPEGAWLELLLRTLPYAAVTVACVLLILRGAAADLTGRGVAWFTVTVFMLVMLRQGQGFIETTRLNRRLTTQAAELERSRDEMEHLAHHDGLTGVLNRDGFYRLLRGAPDHAQLTILMIDLDGFKPVNDTYGHPAGDAVLREVGLRLRGLAGAAFVPARLGASVGVAGQAGGAPARQKGELVMQRADAALYRAKRAGGNRLEVETFTRTHGSAPTG